MTRKIMKLATACLLAVPLYVKAGDLSVDNLTVIDNAEFQGTASIVTPGGNVGMGPFTNRVWGGTNSNDVYLPLDGSDPMTGNLNMGGNGISGASSIAAVNMQITDGATNGAIWVCTNANGTGALRVLSKMKLITFGMSVVPTNWVDIKVSTTPVEKVGNMVALTNGIKVVRSGIYAVSCSVNLNSTAANAWAKFGIRKNTTFASITEYKPRVNDSISGFLSTIVSASSGDVFRAMTYLYGTSSCTNRAGASWGGELSVYELP